MAPFPQQINLRIFFPRAIPGLQQSTYFRRVPTRTDFSLTSFRTGASSHVIAIMNDQSQLKSRVGLPSVRKRGTEAAVPHPDQRQSTSHQFVR
jgi:hypothetical protein